jgi:hypothetical protein
MPQHEHAHLEYCNATVRVAVVPPRYHSNRQLWRACARHQVNEMVASSRTPLNAPNSGIDPHVIKCAIRWCGRATPCHHKKIVASDWRRFLHATTRLFCTSKETRLDRSKLRHLRHQERELGSNISTLLLRRRWQFVLNITRSIICFRIF